MIDQFLKYIVGEGAVIVKAPVAFIAAMLVACGLIYTAVNLIYSTVLSNRDARISVLEERIKLRDDQLADKLHSTPPDEAKSIIQGLEARLKKLSPRRLEESGRAIMAEKLKLPPGKDFRIDIQHDGACADCNIFAADFSTLFSSLQGWSVRNTTVIGLGQIPPSGIGVIVSNPGALSEAEKIVIDAMSSAGIRLNLLRGPQREVNVVLLFTAKTN
ncbi:hypothetical protein RZS28_05370 [Methylocapsa polymorpha]|uniref:Uncharacterized protein n=1 Tax=Methylocapsa polymorpha TaxID=3080828 RepID=A0ABZ0HWK6_9HYPH|nr:hypothetical protein RZS28_05370 [Methylocapsa sp. RX1]